MANEIIQGAINTFKQPTGNGLEIKTELTEKAIQGLRDDLIALQGSTVEQITLTGGGATINTTEIVKSSVDGKLYAYVGDDPFWIDDLGGGVEPTVWKTCGNRELTNKIESLIETGSNANGNYTKFSDGTLICTHITISRDIVTQAAVEYAPLRYYNSNAWTFPYPFVSNPSVNMTPQAATHIGGVGGIESISKIGISIFFKGYSEELVKNKPLYWIAIGRWK